MTNNLFETIKKSNITETDLNFLKNVSVNANNLADLYIEIKRLLNKTNFEETPICYVTMYLLIEQIIDITNDHIRLNPSDLEDEKLMGFYASFLSLYSTFDKKVIRKQAKMFDLFKCKNKKEDK